MYIFSRANMILTGTVFLVCVNGVNDTLPYACSDEALFPPDPFI